MIGVSSLSSPEKLYRLEDSPDIYYTGSFKIHWQITLGRIHGDIQEELGSNYGWIQNDGD